MTKPATGQQPTIQPLRIEPGPPPAPASRHTLKISKRDTYGHEVLLDGTNIANGIDGLTITMRAGRPASVELSMPIIDVTELQDPDTRILIPQATQDVLTALGWTPPAKEQAAEPTADLDITPYLVVHRYRDDRGAWAWSWSCDSDSTCEGHLARDFTSRAHAEANAHRHLAESHSCPESTP